MQNSISVMQFLRQQVKLAERQKIDTLASRIEREAARRQKIDAMRQRLDAIIYKPERNGLV